MTEFSNKPIRSYEQLRSHRWFGTDDNVPSKMRAMTHRCRMNQPGRDESEYVGKPIIGILSTYSDLSMCHMHFRERVEQIKRGVLAAGGFPVEVPVMAMGEILCKPWTSLHRNFCSIETEEVLRAYPIDCAVLMGGCDKTTPAHLMGGISIDIPMIYFPSGPQKRGTWHGDSVASGTTLWECVADCGAGRRPVSDLRDLEQYESPSTGHCMSMGTASTMTSLAEVLGFSLPGLASTPAPTSLHGRGGVLTGRLAVELAWRDWKPSDFLTRESFENALIVYMALAGSTNAVTHLMALAGRAEIPLSLDDLNVASSKVPVLANIAPSGKYVMEDFYDAGGLVGLLNDRLRDLLHLNCLTVTGKTLGENIEKGKVYHDDVIRTMDNPISGTGGLVILKGNLAPRGSVLKTAAGTPSLFKHKGKAVVFDSAKEIFETINDPKYERIITKDSVLVMRSCGPVGGPGFPEWGDLPIPDFLLKQGVSDMVRISDARMSGTCYGTQILHVAPESWVGGPLGLVQTGDMIELNVEKRELNLLISDEEMAKRKAAWKAPESRYPRGYYKLWEDHVEQGDTGYDFDFMKGKGGIPEPEIE